MYRRFARGFVDGLIVAALAVTTVTGIANGFSPSDGWTGLLEQALDWTRRNLGTSVVVFVVVFVVTIKRVHSMKVERRGAENGAGFQQFEQGATLQVALGARASA